VYVRYFQTLASDNFQICATSVGSNHTADSNATSIPGNHRHQILPPVWCCPPMSWFKYMSQCQNCALMCRCGESFWAYLHCQCHRAHYGKNDIIHKTGSIHRAGLRPNWAWCCSPFCASPPLHSSRLLPILPFPPLPLLRSRLPLSGVWGRGPAEIEFGVFFR